MIFSDSPNSPMAAIAEAAGVSRATLYRQFASRDELIKELSLESIRWMDEATAPIFATPMSAADRLQRMLEVWLPFGDRYHFLATENQVTLDPEVDAQNRRQLAELAAFVDDAKREGLFAEPIPTGWIVATIDALVWTAWSSIHRGELALREAPGVVYRTLIDGLGGSG